MSAVEDRVVEQVVQHIITRVEAPHPAFGRQPLCPFARRARVNRRVRFEVHPYSITDHSAVERAAADFDPADHDVLMVLHPDPAGVTFAELARLRDMYAERYGDRFAVFTGHPHDPYTLNGVATRVEPFPNLQFISAALLIDAERRIAGNSRRRSSTVASR